MNPLLRFAAALPFALVLCGAGMPVSPTVASLQAKGMTILGDGDVLREFPGSTFEVSRPGAPASFVESFSTGGERSIAPVAGSGVKPGIRPWWVDRGRVCTSNPVGPPDCGAPYGRLGETFYRISGGSVFMEMRRIKPPKSSGSPPSP